MYCERRNHIHLTKKQCDLLVFGYLRLSMNEYGFNLYDDIKNECWEYFKLITKLHINEFDVGVFYQGYECQIDELNIKSTKYDEDINFTLFYDSNTNDYDNDIFRLRHFWLDYDGKATEHTEQHVSGNKNIGNLKAKQSFEQHTFVTHPWKLYNNNFFLGLYLPKSNYPKHLLTFGKDVRYEYGLYVKLNKLTIQ